MMIERIDVAVPDRRPGDGPSVVWRTFRSGCGFVFAIGSIVVVSLVGSLFSTLFGPFREFSHGLELAGESADVAKRHIPEWPESVGAGDVQRVWYKLESKRDGFSAWYRIKLTSDAASAWMDSLHERQELESTQSLDHRDEGLEGVHRTISGPPPLHRQTGETPMWWSPPADEFRATEIMIWYTNGGSGVGRATYSAFDQSSGLLWIYAYAAQHDLLWNRGEPPPGDAFATVAK